MIVIVIMISINIIIIGNDTQKYLETLVICHYVFSFVRSWRWRACRCQMRCPAFCKWCLST